MTIDFITDVEALEPEWWRVWQASDGTMFQSPAWLLPWIRQFPGERHGAVTLGHDGELVGLLPVFRLEGRWLLWGAGTTDWLDGIFAPELGTADLAAMIARLDAPLDAFQLPPTSKLRLLAGEPRWGEPCIGLDLPATLPRNISENLVYYRRRAARAGVSEVQRLGPEAFEALVDLHTQRWNSAAEPGVLTSPAILAMHREAVPRFQQAGMLRLYGMTLEERLVAVLYALCAKGRTAYYLSGFDPALSALGLGTILVGHAIAEAEREGCTVFDFLRGQEPYKYRWGASDRPSSAAWIEPAGLLDRVAASAS